MKNSLNLIDMLRRMVQPSWVGVMLLVWTGTAVRAAEPLRIMVSIPPQKEIVERIAPDARVTVMLPPGKNPETYMPTPSQVQQLGEAQIYFSIGVPFEQQFLPEIGRTLPNLIVSDLSRGITKRQITEEHAHDGEEHDHEAGEPDPHVWMAPPLLAQMARNTAATLAQLQPERTADYQNYADAYSDEMRSLDVQLKEMLAPYAGRTIFVYHPAFGYFTDAYGLKQEAIEQGGTSPTPRQLARLVAAARADDVHVIFVQPEFDQNKADVIAEAIHGKVVSLNPLDEHIAENLLRIGESIRNAFQ